MDPWKMDALDHFVIKCIHLPIIPIVSETFVFLMLGSLPHMQPKLNQYIQDIMLSIFFFIPFGFKSCFSVSCFGGDLFGPFFKSEYNLCENNND